MGTLLGIRLQFALPLAFLAILLPRGEAEEGKRIALVVGNDNYPPPAKLHNAVNDARIIDQALKKVGFRTILKENANQADMDTAASEFLSQLGPDDTALFFYAGHAVQIESQNFLIPAEFAGADSVILAKFKFFRMAELFEELNNRHPKRTIVILDACRRNPLQESQSLEQGLIGKQNVGKETYVAFSAGEGQLATDNPDGRNSWFSEELADLIVQPGLTIDDVFTQVGKRVSAKTGTNQTPYKTSNLTSRFYFIPPANAESSIDPTLPEKWMEEARKREQREDWAEAIRLVQQVLKSQPSGSLKAAADRKLPYLNARKDAQMHYEASEFAAAAVSDEEALRLDPFALSAAFQAIDCYLLADRLPEAIRLLRQIRAWGTTVAVDRTGIMLRALAPVEPEAGKVLDTEIPQPPPIEELLRDTRLHLPDFDAGARYLQSTPVDLTQWGNEVTTALTPPNPLDQLALQETGAGAENEAKTAAAILHVEVDPKGGTRDLEVKKVGGTTGSVEIDGPERSMAVWLQGAPFKPQLPAHLDLPPGKYIVKTVEAGETLSEKIVEVKPSATERVNLGGKQ